jgi:O-antigen ligase
MRIGWARMGWAMIKEKPFLGHGFANFPVQYNKYVHLSPEVPKTVHWPHNSFLQIWAECGIFALLAYLSIYVIAAANLYKTIKTSRDPTIKLAAISSLSILVGMILFGLTAIAILFEVYWFNFALASIIPNLSKSTTIQHGTSMNLVSHNRLSRENIE